MAAENLDDHNRSGRFTARDFAINYLNSTEPDSILFTIGDNDTFPLWYAQEVEGIRTEHITRPVPQKMPMNYLKDILILHRKSLNTINPFLKDLSDSWLMKNVPPSS